MSKIPWESISRMPMESLDRVGVLEEFKIGHETSYILDYIDHFSQNNLLMASEAAQFGNSLAKSGDFLDQNWKCFIFIHQFGGTDNSDVGRNVPLKLILAQFC